MTALTPSGDRVTTIASLFAAMSIGASLAWMYKSQSDRQYKRIPTELLRSTYAKELRLALNLALQCGNNMMQHYSKKGTLDQLSESDLGISTKGCAEDFCTIIDVMNENLVIDGIQTYFPLHKIIGEESTGTGEIPPLTNAPTWIIDPIDGTTNFASGLPLSCVSLGFCVDGKPVLGVVYAPATKEIYLAVRGHGAYRNGVKLDPMKKVTPLSSAVVNTEFGYARSKEAVKIMLQGLGRIMTHGCRTTRQMGSGVLDLCYVASGRLDIVYSGLAGEGWKPWDYCAGLVVCLEAGCAMEALMNHTDGIEFDIYSTSVICATTKVLLDETRKVLLYGE
jgi:fructose-1,6-bisphosphatase/inositol monophosphatase family enzyme